MRSSEKDIATMKADIAEFQAERQAAFNPEERKGRLL